MIEIIHVYVTARCDIVFNCFSYDFFMGHLHQNRFICKVSIIVVFYEQVYCHVMWEVNVQEFNFASSALSVFIFSISFVSIYKKHNFLQICTACKSDTTQKAIFDVICHVIFHIFAELKLCMIIIGVVTGEAWCTYMLYSNIVSYWKLSYVEVK